jgi:zinc-binding alcohol dehydrogenase/oxidoreductase
MHALAVRAPGRLEYGELPDPEPGPGEVVVELRTAALNRRDLGVVSGRYGEVVYPFVPGSDGAGIRRDTGEEVVIFPSLNWGPREEYPGPGFDILGGRRWGTHAELVAVPQENVLPKPRRLSWEEAGSFPLAGLTAYRALFTRARLRQDETALVLGAGSGVSTFAIQLAASIGARVLVTSSSEAKLDLARQLGADGGVLYTDGDWATAIRALTASGEGVDVVVDSVGATWPHSLRALRGGGRLVTFGATVPGEVALEPREVYWQQVSILGTTMGSRSDFQTLLRLIDAAEWHPALDSVWPLADGTAAYERLESGEQAGKVVLRIA